MKTTAIVTTMILVALVGCGDPQQMIDEDSLFQAARQAADNAPAEPSFEDDPERHFAWFADRYLAELSETYSTPYQDTTHNREERLRYQPLSHEMEFKASESPDTPPTGTLTIAIESIEDPNDEKSDTYKTDCKMRFTWQDGQWLVADGQLYDPSFESWSPIQDLAWEAPFFEAARKVYGIESDGF